MPLKIETGDRIRLKKNHACGGNQFVVMRAGMDFRIQCQTCGAQIWMKRGELEKRIKKIEQPLEAEKKAEAGAGRPN